MRGPCATTLGDSGLPPRRSLPAITRPYEPNRNPRSDDALLAGRTTTSPTVTFGSGFGGSGFGGSTLAGGSGFGGGSSGFGGSPGSGCAYAADVSAMTSQAGTD